MFLILSEHAMPRLAGASRTSKSILNHPCYESNCLCARIKAREAMRRRHCARGTFGKHEKNVRMEGEYAAHAGGSSGALSCSRRENQLRSFVPARESLIRRKGRSALHRQGSSQEHGREHLSIVVDVPWKVNAARYHASRFNEPVSFVSYPFAQAHDPQRTFSRTFELDSINRHILFCDGMVHVSTVIGGERYEFAFVTKFNYYSLSYAYWDWDCNPISS